MPGLNSNDKLYGEHNDIMSGEGGNDDPSGGQGVEWMIGGDGNDVLDGGIENDTIIGDGGSDFFTRLAALVATVSSSRARPQPWGPTHHRFSRWHRSNYTGAPRRHQVHRGRRGGHSICSQRARWGRCSGRDHPAGVHFSIVLDDPLAKLSAAMISASDFQFA